MTIQDRFATPEVSPAKKRFADLIEYFLHPSLRSNPDVLYRARTLIALLLVYDVMLAFGTCATVYQLVTNGSLWPQLNGLILCLLSIAFNSYLLIRLRRKGSYFSSSAAAILIATATVIAGMAISGGVRHSPSTALLVVPPLMAYFFGGMRWGSYSVLLCFVAIALFILIEFAGFRFPRSIISEQDAKIDQLVTCFIGICAVSAMAFAYELTSTSLQQERDREHRKALALSQTDALTGLANRRNFDTNLEQRVASYGALSPPRHFVLGCIDLDGFKQINDCYGHAVGDEVLRVVAERLRLSCRDGDVVARHGGDEFLILFDTKSDAADSDAAGIETMALRLSASLSEPINTTVGTLAIGASLGFAAFPRDANTPLELRRAADRAMYAAKDNPGARWHTSSSAMNSLAKVAAIGSPVQAATFADVGSTSFASDRPQYAAHTSVEGTAPPKRKGGPLWRLATRCVHPSLQARPDQLHRARLLAMTLLLIFSIMSLTSIYAAVGPFPFRSKASTLTICIAIAIIAVYLLWLLRRYGNYRVCSLSTVILAYAGIMAGVCISGGASVSVSTPVLIFPPVIAYFFGGMRWGTYTALATVIEIAVFAVLEFAGFRFYNFVEPQVEVYNRVMNCLVCFFSVSGMAFIYEFTAIGLKRQRDREKAVVDRLAHTDALTGLANRSSFDAELQARIARYKATGSHFALCCIDLDGFKPINDRYGHDVGDEVLQAVSERLRQCLREADYLGRDGGDEFMLLFDGIKGGSQLEMMAARLSQSIAPPIPTRAGSVSVGASLGFAVFPDDGDSADALRRSADKAMYTAKRRGSSGIGAYGPGFPTPNPSPA